MENAFQRTRKHLCPLNFARHLQEEAGIQTLEIQVFWMRLSDAGEHSASNDNSDDNSDGNWEGRERINLATIGIIADNYVQSHFLLPKYSC